LLLAIAAGLHQSKLRFNWFQDREIIPLVEAGGCGHLRAEVLVSANSVVLYMRRFVSLDQSIVSDVFPTYDIIVLMDGFIYFIFDNETDSFLDIP
jgi:hypothetical protein